MLCIEELMPSMLVEGRYMPLKFAHRKDSEVAQPNAQGKVNEDLEAMKRELSRVGRDMVLEIETGSVDAVRRTKMLVTRASNQLGLKFQHWHSGSKVFAKAAPAVRERARRATTGARRGRPRSS